MPQAMLAHFVEKLCGSPILDPLQREEALRLSHSFPNPREFAQELLRRDWLTPYQANQIAQGKEDDLVLGQYVILERLGEGGMGQVFKARQRNLDRIVAFKLIHPSCLENERVIQRFMREIRAAGQLSHPNIVRAYDADFIRGHWFIAMEYIDGGDLSREVRSRGPLPVIAACDYIRQAALGLQHAHERGMVHRDIKPANLLLTQHADKPRLSNPRMARPNLDRESRASKPKETERPWGTVKILDLGLARLGDSASGSIANLTQINTVMGTPDYISPEQTFNSKGCDIRSDLYSLGCTFYFMLTGQPPFSDGTLTEKLMHHQNDDPTSPSWVRATRLAANGDTDLATADAQVPAEVEAVLRKLMAKKPEQRFQTPGQVAIVLEGVIEALRSGTTKRANDGATIAIPAAMGILVAAKSKQEPIEVEMRSASVVLPPPQPTAVQPLVKPLTMKRRSQWRSRLLMGGLAALAVAGAVLTFAASRSWSHAETTKSVSSRPKSK